MALLWIEGFEGFGTSIGGAPSPTGIVSRKYPAVGRETYMDVEVGRGGSGYCLEFESSQYAPCTIQSPNLTTNTTCVFGMAVCLASLPGLSQRPLFSLYDGVTQGVNVKINTDGTLTIERGTTELGTTSNSISADIWYYIELKVLTDNSAGTAELRVNEASWLSLTSQDTQPGANAYHTAFNICPPDDILTKYDDIYFLDGSGSVNNDFLGNRKVVAINPNGAGDSTDWTPSTGSNYENVDDGGLLDEDTTYNETSTDTHQDLYTYDDLPAEVTSVDGIQITSEVRVISGSMDLSNVIKTGTTTSPGTPETITSPTYVSVIRVEEQDPDTVTAWTPAGVNGAQFGIKANV